MITNHRGRFSHEELHGCAYRCHCYRTVRCDGGLHSERDDAHVVVPAQGGEPIDEARYEALPADVRQTIDEHPVLGHLTREEWTQFHLRHAELHMSFVRSA